MIYFQQLFEQEKQFAEGQDAKRNRATLLRILMDLAPKTRKNNKVTALDVVRSSMKRLADDSVWQYVSALGRYGTKKIAMREVMPSIMDVIPLTAVKVLEVDCREATTAL